ncbi:uncharacterized protein [Amphiura filiformis]|uniref:uncharacterized protein n=1 Tax=Amphiura filiformis TaxID=82378 RepID=UPI003B214DA2
MMMEPPVPGGRLPPLKLLHGQAALDLDTPPPSPGVTSPGEPTILMVPVLRSPRMTFSSEEINHSVATLDQCFQILNPGKYPALHAHGRVSSAFVHNKYSVTLAEHYAILQDLMVSRSRLLFNRDCSVRISQLAEYVHSLKVIVHEEYNTLQQIFRQCPQKVCTKLEYLPSLCEDFRVHLNHWTSLQHRVRSDKWLQPLLVELLCAELEHVHNTLLYWQDCALSWLHRMVDVGLCVFAHCPPGSITQDMLWSIVRGIEDFNAILKLVKQTAPDAAAEQYKYLNVPHMSSIHSSSNIPMPSPLKHRINRKRLICNRPFSVHRIIAILAKERAKPAAFQILNYFSGSSAVRYATSCKPMAFHWPSYPPNTSQSRMPEDKSGSKPVPSQGQKERAIFSLEQLSHFDISQDQCPIRAIEAQEDDLLSKFLVALAMSTSLLQYPQLRSDSSTESNAPSPRKNGRGGRAKSPPSKRRNDKHEHRKSVHWGDSLDSSLKDKLFGRYLRQFWQLTWLELLDLLHRPSLTTVGKTDGAIGHVYACSDALVMSLVYIMEQACDQGLMTAGCEQSVLCVTRELHSSAAIACWDSSVCQAQGSSATDKCLPATISHSEEGSRTCQLFQQSYSPLLSLLVALEQDELISAKLKPKVKNGVTMSLQSVIPMVMAQCFQHAILTLDLVTHWCHVKSLQFLASWSVEQFLLILQSDIKVTTDMAVRFLKIIQTLNCASPSPDSSPTRSSSSCSYVSEHQKRQLDKLRLQLDARNARLHNLCGQCNKMFQSDCSKMCVDFWKQTMPVGKVWRRKTTEVLPSEHNPYAASAVDTLLVPLFEGVSKLKTAAQISVISIAVTTMLETWMAFVLKEKPKFSYHGAHQLELDFSYVRRWISSDASGQSAETTQSILSLEVFRHFDGAILLLKQQPRNRGFLGVRTPSKEDLASEYSCSTAPSAESHRGSLSDMSDSVGPSMTPSGAVGGIGLPASGPVMSPTQDVPDGSEMGESGFDEETFRIPNRREWLSLRVHGNKTWKLPFGTCFNSTMDP